MHGLSHGIFVVTNVVLCDYYAYYKCVQLFISSMSARVLYSLVVIESASCMDFACISK